MILLDASAIRRKITLTKYGFVYNWWATQDVEASQTDVPGSDWNTFNSNTNLAQVSPSPFNCIVDGVEFTQRTDLGSNYLALGQGEWMWWSDEVDTLAVRGLSDEDFSLEEDGYVVLNKVEARSIIPAAMAAEGWAVPTDADFTTLATYLGGASVAGGKLKETGTTYWNSPNTGATNEVGFNARGAGLRSVLGVYTYLKDYLLIWSRTESDASNAFRTRMDYNAAQTQQIAASKLNGLSLSPFRPATTAEQLLDDGAIAATYTGNDGKIYRCTKIGTQVWVADNLAETKWSDGTWIKGYDGGTYTAITNAAWVALTEAALCAYDDDLSNVLI